MNYNVFIRLLLRSPFHGMYSKSTMLVTLTGRKSRRTLTLPVSYYYGDDKTLMTISARNRNWWRNLKGGADVILRLRGRDIAARGDAILDREVVAAQLRDYISRYPRVARYIFIRMEDGVPNEEDLIEQADRRLFVRFTLK